MPWDNSKTISRGTTSLFLQTIFSCPIPTLVGGGDFLIWTQRVTFETLRPFRYLIRVMFTDRKTERKKDRKKRTKTQFNIVIPGHFDTLAMFYLISVIRGVWEVQEV